MRQHIPLSVKLLRYYLIPRPKACPFPIQRNNSTTPDHDPSTPGLSDSELESQASPIASSSKTVFDPVVTEDFTKPFYVTAPPFSTTGPPHLGHIHSLILADTFARYSRLREPDRETHLSTGTSESSVQLQRAAEKAKKELHEYCDTSRQKYKDLVNTTRVDVGDIVSTQAERHIVAVQDLWERLVASGDIYQAPRPGWYDLLGELNTEDQLHQTEGRTLTKGGEEVRWAEETVWMFKLSKFRDQLLGWIERPLSIHPPSLRFKLMSQISSVEDIPVSRPRKSEWGLGVPGDIGQVIDGSLDGVVMYITSLGYPGYTDIWPADIHVVGMDLLKSHTTLWPAMLFSAGISPPRSILAHSHWTKNGTKLSHESNDVVDPKGLMRFYGVEALRWHVLRSGPGAKEAEFSIQRLETDYTFLSTHLAHLSNRILNKALIDKAGEFVPSDRDKDLEKTMTEAKPEFTRRIEALDLAQACEVVVDLVDGANRTWKQLEPWNASNPSTALYYAYHALRISGTLLQPILPNKSQDLLDRLAVPITERRLEDAMFDLENSGVDFRLTLDRLFEGERMVDRLALRTMFTQLRWKKDELAKHGRLVRPAS